MADQLDLFAGAEEPEKPAGDLVRRLRVLITVKAAPVPSVRHGETVCVAGISVDLDAPGWIRLYPINFRFLEQDLTFRKYDVVSVDAVPARNDARRESWRPRMDTLRVERHLNGWGPRSPWLAPLITTSMCGMARAAATSPPGPSLGLIRPRRIDGFDCQPHRGWTHEEQAKIQAYVNQLDLFDSTDKTPLQAPRMTGRYRWHCFDLECRGHEQSLLDWEFVALQRRLAHLPDEELARALRQRFFTEMCRPENDVAFYVGNQAARWHTFSVLGVFYSRRRA